MDNLLKGGCVKSLVFLFLIFLAIRGCAEQSEKEAEYWKDKTACDCVKAYENNEIEFNDLFYTDVDGGIFPFGGRFHPCEDIAYLSENDSWEAFNDSLTPTKSDTILTLRRLSNCD